MTNEEIATEIKTNGDPDGTLTLQLLRQNKGYIHLRAKPFINAGVCESDELMSIGFISCKQAIDKWDASKGGGFIRVWDWFLLRQLIHTANTSRSTAVSYRLNSLINEYVRYKSDFYKVNNRDPTEEETCFSLGWNARQYLDVMTVLSIENAMRLDAPVQDQPEDGEEIVLADTVQDFSVNIEDSAISVVYISDLRQALFFEIEKLPEDEKNIIQMHLLYSVPIENNAERNLYRKAIQHLRRPASKDRLRKFLNENPYHGTGQSTFERTWTSQPERFVISHDMEGGIKSEFSRNDCRQTSATAAARRDPK